jgi:hypothetical protein
MCHVWTYGGFICAGSEEVIVIVVDDVDCVDAHIFKPVISVSLVLVLIVVVVVIRI